MTTSPLHQAFRRSLCLPPTATADSWHRQTQQPDPGAASYAYVHFGLTFVTPVGTGIGVRRPWQAFTPADMHFQQLPVNGLGGVVMGSTLVTQLLISQQDAVARGMVKRNG